MSEPVPPIRMFLAHAKEDEAAVNALYGRLKRQGYHPWLDKVDLLPGQRWRDEIPRAIAASDLFIACLSECSVTKQGYVQREFKLALNVCADRPPGTIYLIPLRLDDCLIPDLRQAEYGISLLDYQWLDYFEPDGFERLVKAITHYFPERSRPATRVSPPPPPAKAPYTEDLGQGGGLEMVDVPGGRLWMGSLENEPERSGHEGPQHKERLDLIQTLNRLPEAQFKELVFALNPPSGTLPASSASQGDWVFKLLQWVENTGPGLTELRKALDWVLGKTLETSVSAAKEQAPEPPKPEPSKRNDLFTEDLGYGVILDMVYVPGGRFWMGRKARKSEGHNKEGPLHKVTVSSFCMGKYPVTQRQWHAVSLLDGLERELKPDPSFFTGDNHPVEQVSWDDAAEFCARLSAHTGKDYRLPSEAEWEYAGRAGKWKPFQASHAEESKQRTAEVGSSAPNALGLYDMHSNVYEWCLDHWHENYDGAPADGSAWIVGMHDSLRVRRGSSCVDPPERDNLARRDRKHCAYRDPYTGFRVVCRTLHPSCQ